MIFNIFVVVLIKLLNRMIDIERHPWKPFLPANAKVLIMGTFPPTQNRWSMDFYYPNRTNDFWYMMGLIFFGDKFFLYNKDKKIFYLDRIKDLLYAKGIALSDTGFEIRRLKGNASDKFLEIVTPTPLPKILKEIPDCHNIATTGEKAAKVIAELTNTEMPKIGEFTTSESGLNLWRMPSTSRAYPLAIEKKAEYYERLFKFIGII